MYKKYRIFGKKVYTFLSDMQGGGGCRMSLSISTEQNRSKQENTARLVGEYLRSVVRKMRKVDYAARFFDELPKRHTEKAVAEKYVRQNPLRVKNTAAALNLKSATR